MIRTLIRTLHHRASHIERTTILADIIAGEIAKLGNASPVCLDVGCGDMLLTRKMQRALPAGTFYGVDVYNQDGSEKYGIQYKQFDGSVIPFNNDVFDIVTIIDVLHHVSPEQQQQLLLEAKRVGKTLIIKDHVTSGAWSSMLLYVADVFGNWGKRVSSPGVYFNQERYSSLLRNVGYREISRINDIDLYKNMPLICHVMKPYWQMISVVKNKTLSRAS